MRNLTFLSLFLFATASPALASDISVTGAWSPPSLTETTTSGAVYFTLHNGGTTAVSLSGVSTDVAEMAMAHATVVEDDVAKMVDLEGIAIAPGTDFVFSPGKNHIMLMGLKKPLHEGDHFTLTLATQDGGTLPVDVTVQKQAPTP
ncbi:MAG: copper chaperone PCu(A)C [Hyphomicrobiales bacterium]